MTAVDTATEEWLTWRRGGIGASDVAKAHTGRYGGKYSVEVWRPADWPCINRTLRATRPATTKETDQ